MTRLSLPRTPVGIAYLLAVLLPGLASVAFGAALLVKCTRRPEVLLVPPNDDPRVVTPGVVPDALARDFARDFVVTLENYVPATLERNVLFLEGRVAPEESHAFQRLTLGLQQLVRESKQASQLALDDPLAAPVLRESGRVEVVLRGIRKIWVDSRTSASALLQEARVTYRVAVIPGEPSRENPTGLRVAGFAVRLAEGRLEERGDGKEKSHGSR